MNNRWRADLIRYTLVILIIMVGVIASLKATGTRPGGLTPGNISTLEKSAEKEWLDCFSACNCRVRIKPISEKKCIVLATLDWKDDDSHNELIIKGILNHRDRRQLRDKNTDSL